MKKHTGFTLIELIVVILILGILAATALPKFVSIEKEANEGAYKGGVGAFQAAVMLVHAKWLAAGKPAAGDLTIDTGVTVYVNANGWPESTDSAAINAEADCAAIWTGLLQQNAPSVAASAAWVNEDYNVALTGGTDCEFDYRAGGVGAADMEFTYETDTGLINIVDAVNDGA